MHDPVADFWVNGQTAQYSDSQCVAESGGVSVDDKKLLNKAEYAEGGMDNATPTYAHSLSKKAFNATAALFPKKETPAVAHWAKEHSDPKDPDHERAASYHDIAAGMHEGEAKMSRHDFNKSVAHIDAAKAHRLASEWHSKIAASKGAE